MASTDLPTLVPFQSAYGVSLGMAVIFPAIFYAVSYWGERPTRQRGTRSMSSWAFGFLAHAMIAGWYCLATPTYYQAVIWDGTTVPSVPMLTVGTTVLLTSLVFMVYSYYGHSDHQSYMPLDSTEAQSAPNSQNAHPMYSRHYWGSVTGIWAAVAYLFYSLPWAVQQTDPTNLWYMFGISLAGGLGFLAALIKTGIYIGYETTGSSDSQARVRRYDKWGACLAMVIIFSVIALGVPVWNWISPAIATGQPTYTLQTALIVSDCVVYGAGLVALIHWFYFDLVKFDHSASVATTASKSR